MSFLGISGRTYLVTGSVANKKSVAWHIAQVLEAEERAGDLQRLRFASLGANRWPSCWPGASC